MQSQSHHDREQISQGASLRTMLRTARRIGCHVTPKRRTGEVIVIDPATGERVTVNARRKDASRALTGFLRRVLVLTMAAGLTVSMVGCGGDENENTQKLAQERERRIAAEQLARQAQMDAEAARIGSQRMVAFGVPFAVIAALGLGYLGIALGTKAKAELEESHDVD